MKEDKAFQSFVDKLGEGEYTCLSFEGIVGFEVGSIVTNVCHSIPENPKKAKTFIALVKLVNKEE